MKLQRWIVGCEQSGAIRDRITAAGHIATSIDLLPARTPGNHHQGDILEYLDSLEPGEVDGGIFHPTCTKLTVAANQCLYHPEDKALPASERRPHPKWPDRAAEVTEAVEFVIALHSKAIAKMPKVVIENPVGVLSTRWRKPSQTVQPFDFGDDASKRTCFWIDGLPKLVADPALRFPGRIVWDAKLGKMVERWANQTDGGQNKEPPNELRWKIRSDTFAGIADAMVAQWVVGTGLL